MERYHKHRVTQVRSHLLHCSRSPAVRVRINPIRTELNTYCRGDTRGQRGFHAVTRSPGETIRVEFHVCIVGGKERQPTWRQRDYYSIPRRRCPASARPRKPPTHPYTAHQRRLRHQRLRIYPLEECYTAARHETAPRSRQRSG